MVVERCVADACVRIDGNKVILYTYGKRYIIELECHVKDVKEVTGERPWESSLYTA